VKGVAESAKHGHRFALAGFKKGSGVVAASGPKAGTMLAWSLHNDFRPLVEPCPFFDPDPEGAPAEK
jgi:hypothetical protein